MLNDCLVFIMDKHCLKGPDACPENGRLRDTADTREPEWVLERFRYAKTHPIINVSKLSASYELRYGRHYIHLYGIENLWICKSQHK